MRVGRHRATIVVGEVNGVMPSLHARFLVKGGASGAPSYRYPGDGGLNTWGHWVPDYK